jgi:hypothetical protein
VSLGRQLLIPFPAPCSSADDEGDEDGDPLGSSGQDHPDSTSAEEMEAEQQRADRGGEDSDGDTRWEEASSGGDWADARE